MSGYGSLHANFSSWPTDRLAFCPCRALRSLKSPCGGVLPFLPMSNVASIGLCCLCSSLQFAAAGPIACTGPPPRYKSPAAAVLCPLSPFPYPRLLRVSGTPIRISVRLWTHISYCHIPSPALLVNPQKSNYHSPLISIVSHPIVIKKIIAPCLFSSFSLEFYSN